MLGGLLKIFKLATIVLALIVIAVASSVIAAQAGQISDSSAYKSCVDDSECGENEYCDDGECQQTKRW